MVDSEQSNTEDITFEELQHFWDEIDNIIRPCPPRQSGDIGARELLEHYNLPADGNFKWAYERMDKLVATGNWEKLKVHDPKLNRGVVIVRRKQI